jgi:signal transduction histidine kinase
MRAPGGRTGELRKKLERSARKLETTAQAIGLKARSLSVNGGIPHTKGRATPLEWQQFLLQATELLLGAIDVKTSLGEIARHALVSSLADGCAIDLSDEVDEATSTIEHIRSGNEEAWHAARGILSSGPDSCLKRVMFTGEPRLFRESGAVDGLAPLFATGLGGAIVVPMVARGRLLGALTLAVFGRPRTYSSTDFTMTQDLGHRIALAVDNALLVQSLEAAVRARDDFLTMASHELRTPLTTLGLALERMGKLKASDPTRLRKLQARAQHRFLHLAAVVENLEGSSLGVHRRSLSPERVDLVERTRSVVARFKSDLALAGCTVRLEHQGSCEGAWDRHRVDQLVANLVLNAVKYGAGRPIEISILGDDERVRFEIRDHGIGIPADKLDRIFGRFERAVAPRGYSGLGLGLYVAQQIVEAHGGRIAASSGSREGTILRFELPHTLSDDPAAV